MTAARILYFVDNLCREPFGIELDIDFEIKNLKAVKIIWIFELHDDQKEQKDRRARDLFTFFCEDRRVQKISISMTEA